VESARKDCPVEEIFFNEVEESFIYPAGIPGKKLVVGSGVEFKDARKTFMAFFCWGVSAFDNTERYVLFFMAAVFFAYVFPLVFVEPGKKIIKVPVQGGGI
jgi:hypothetical protein